VLVVSTDPAHSLGDVLDVPVGPAERRVAAGLTALEIDPEEEAGGYIDSVKRQMKALTHPRMYAEVDRQLDLARLAPGTMEAALLERMAELIDAAGARFDLVVFDTAPTGHTLRLLALPEIMAAWTDGLLRHDERATRLSSLVRRFGGPRRDDVSLVGAGAGGHPEGTRAARLTEILRRRQAKLRAARERLLDPAATAFILVLNPDRLSILESRKALASLERAGIPVAAVVVNRVLPDDAGGAFLEARRRQEEPYRRQIEEAFAGLPRLVVPLLPADVHGIEALRRFGERLTSPG
jgi:arsenite-transporting ATPase